MSPTPATASADACLAREKAVLFCPTCWHESPVCGDWQVTSTAAGDRFECPACGDTVTVRPRVEPTTAPTLLPVVACSLALARMTTRCLALGRRLCMPGGSRDGTPCSPSTATDSPCCQP
ncbi:hypothetical protein SAMN05216226_11536 [Halovenus aranensis]|jgi:DNA-directed RNA polymerase subunit RPC12/RpoP|uniref:DUF8106 domain-containing protein n=1 Tax=Halovenus aranensis TaxID=890420 RepID=A0A1G8YNG8_9EURY|nr:hypothetical protein [Halovenus aranensis]SDK03590.1 hypothetical protein SAMN05216226_11536 [Halovenus aranensis]